LGINDEALLASDKAIGIDPKLAIAWKNKGNALDGLVRYDEAIQSYNKASSIDQMYSISMVTKGNSHYNAGEYVAAIRYYDEALKKDSKDKNAWYNKADALRMLHRNSEAEAAYAKARELGYNGAMTLMEMTAK
jgi:tetratricopeptide (TPR) repeat protein